MKGKPTKFIFPTSQVVKLDSNMQKGVSVKLGNIRLNMRTLPTDSSEILLSIIGVNDYTYLIQLAALIIWN